MKRALLHVASLITSLVACGRHAEPDPAGQPAAPPAVPAKPATPAKPAPAHAAGVMVWIHGAKPLSEADALDLEDQVRVELAERAPQVAFDVHRRPASEGEMKVGNHLDLLVRDTTVPYAKGPAGAVALTKRELDVSWFHQDQPGALTADPPFTLDYTPEAPPDHPGSASGEDPLLLAQVHANHALAHDLAARLPKL